MQLMQLVCNYYGNIMLMSFFIDLSKFNTWHYGDFWVNFFLTSIFTIHYDCSIIMVLDYNKVKAWLGRSKVAFESPQFKISNFFCNFNNYQTINPIIIPYAFNHKY